MTREQAQKVVQDSILDYADITPGQYQLEDSFTSLGIDSLGVVQISLVIEERLGISHLDGAENLFKLNRVIDFVDLVEKVTTVIQ